VSPSTGDHAITASGRIRACPVLREPSPYYRSLLNEVICRAAATAPHSTPPAAALVEPCRSAFWLPEGIGTGSNRGASLGASNSHLLTGQLLHSYASIQRVYHIGSTLSVARVRQFVWRTFDTPCGANATPKWRTSYAQVLAKA
jgi:hypothetical protein